MNRVLEAIGKIVVMQEKMARDEIREYIDVIYNDLVIASFETREEVAEYLGVSTGAVGSYFSERNAELENKINGHELAYRLELV